MLSSNIHAVLFDMFLFLLKVVNMDSINKQFCPYCQMPFSLVHIRNLNLHLEVCFRRKKSKKECPKGLTCDSCMISHYERFSHKTLAKLRANNNVDISLLHSADSDVCNSQNANSIEDFDESCLVSKDKTLLSRVVSEDKAESINNSIDQIKVKKETQETNCSFKTWVNPFLNESSDKYPVDSGSESVFSQTSLPFSMSTTINKKVKEEPSFLTDVIKCANEMKDTTMDFGVSNVNTIDSETFSSFLATSTQVCDSLPNIPDSVEFTNENEFNPFVTLNSSENNTNLKMEKSISKSNVLNVLKRDLKKNMENQLPDKMIQKDIGNMMFGLNPQKSVKEEKYTPPVTRPSSKVKRQCPFYKKICNTAIAVDAFSYGSVPDISFYMLTHFHYDHYIGLTKQWSHNIYCSEVTGNLVESKIHVSKDKIKRLPMNQLVNLGVNNVILLEANHCPGSVLFLFSLYNGQTILHTGDFRADDELISHPALCGVRINVLYLDTTYLNPSYAFPPQNVVVNYTKQLVKKLLSKEPKTLFVTGTYTIGKEKIFLGIASALKSKIFVTREKQRTMACLNNNGINNLLTLNARDTNLHVLQMKFLNVQGLKKHLNKLSNNYKQVVAIKPTGWTHSNGNGDLDEIKPIVSGLVKIYGLPYSEHSSFNELQSFVRRHKPDQVIPTVNVGKKERRQEMESYLNCWRTGR